MGRGKTYPMSLVSNISFSHSSEKACLLVSSQFQEIFPPEFSSKFKMSRVLGTGASGEVRLAFRVGDMHRVAVKIIKKPPTSPFAAYRGPSSDQ